MPRLPDRTDAARTELAEDQSPPRPAWLPTGLLLALALLWLGAMMWRAHALIAGNVADPAVALGSAANALPVVVAASIVAGVAAGLAVAGRFGTRARGRLLAGGLAGVVCGGVAAAVIILGYGSNASVAVLAATVGLGAVLGGAAAALPRAVLVAALTASLGALVVSVLISEYQSPLVELFGAGDSPASKEAAATRLAYAQAMVCGLVAGTIAHVGLRRVAHGLAWPAYLLAGAGPGLMLLLAEAVTRIGGASLMEYVRDLSPADRAFMAYAENARLRNALIIGFVGGILAMILYGRALPSRAEEPPAQD